MNERSAAQPVESFAALVGTLAVPEASMLVPVREVRLPDMMAPWILQTAAVLAQCVGKTGAGVRPFRQRCRGGRELYLPLFCLCQLMRPMFADVAGDGNSANEIHTPQCKIPQGRGFYSG